MTMYTPYFRGWQHELRALQKSLGVLKKSTVVPIIEPVKIRNLQKTLTYFRGLKLPLFFILNPKFGDYKKYSITEMLRLVSGYPECILGLAIDEKTTATEIKKFISVSTGQQQALIHFSPVSNVTELITISNVKKNALYQVFIDSTTLTLSYMEKFKTFPRIWIQNGFNRGGVKNADFEEEDFFSDLPFKYKELGFIGFGDFLIIGDKREKPQGRAYAVTIHLTRLNYDTITDEPFISCKHFVSDDTKGFRNTEGKFLQALNKFAKNKGEFVETQGIKKYFELKKEEHFPQLGTVKEISMIHHIEFMASIDSQ